MKIAITGQQQLQLAQLQKMVEKYGEVELITADEDILSRKLSDHHIDVLFINILDVTSRIEQVIREHIPYLIVTSSLASTEIAKQVIEIGAKAYLPHPYDEPEIEKIMTKAQKYLNDFKKSAVYKRRSRLIALTSGRGGVGKSTLAINLGVLMQTEYKQKVLILDLVSYYGSVDVLLDVSHDRDLGQLPNDFAQYGQENAWADIESSLIRHSCGVEVLKVGDARWDAAQAKKMQDVLTVIKEQGRYDYIIVDTESSVNDALAVVGEIADAVLYVTLLDVPAIKTTDTAIEVIKSLYVSTDKIKVVVNRYNDKSAVTIDELERYTAIKVAASVGEQRDGLLFDTINRGIPFVLEYKQHVYTQELRKIVSLFVRRDTQESIELNTRSKFSQLFFKK